MTLPRKSVSFANGTAIPHVLSHHHPAIIVLARVRALDRRDQLDIEATRQVVDETRCEDHRGDVEITARERWKLGHRRRGRLLDFEVDVLGGKVAAVDRDQDRQVAEHRRVERKSHHVVRRPSRDERNAARTIDGPDQCAAPTGTGVRRCPQLLVLS